MWTKRITCVYNGSAVAECNAFRDKFLLLKKNKSIWQSKHSARIYGMTILLWNCSSIKLNKILIQQSRKHIHEVTRCSTNEHFSFMYALCCCFFSRIYSINIFRKQKPRLPYIRLSTITAHISLNLLSNLWKCNVEKCNKLLRLLLYQV